MSHCVGPCRLPPRSERCRGRHFRTAPPPRSLDYARDDKSWKISVDDSMTRRLDDVSAPAQLPRLLSG